MSRDQRVRDNHALLFAQDLALSSHAPLVVLHHLFADYPHLSRRQACLAIDGLKQVETDLAKLNIPMQVVTEPKLYGLIDRLPTSAVVTDFSPLKQSRIWKDRLVVRTAVAVYEVDAHNIVPVRQVSTKQEYAAYTLRPKINRLLPEFLTDIPKVKKHPFPLTSLSPATDWKKIERLAADLSGPGAVAGFPSGEKAAHRQLKRFVSKHLADYHDLSNDPVVDAQSGLSPYLHFGQISAQRVALQMQRYDAEIKSQESFVEQLIVRRELSDNFCRYNPHYDHFDGFPRWARETLHDHRSDPRPYIYTPEQFEQAQTHDELWNAAQRQLLSTGKMHGYMRMYWAKKILEWSVSPEDALAEAIYLNDTYSLDGHDPNGYTGIAWSIGGVHDRPWFEREVFGKVRFMSFGGCKRKFNINAYINNTNQISAKPMA
jgi:deoxyribodipyrimidine photo-lyase